MSNEADDYDEFGLLADNAAEAGLALSALPPVTGSHSPSPSRPAAATPPPRPNVAFESYY